MFVPQAASPSASEESLAVVLCPDQGKDVKTPSSTAMKMFLKFFTSSLIGQ
jgi:hypothetical protein